MEAEELKDEVRACIKLVDYHDGEDNSAVLVDITSSHAEDPVGRPGVGEGGQGQLDGLGVTVAGRLRGELKI